MGTGHSERPIIEEVARLQAELGSLRDSFAVAKHRLDESRAREHTASLYAEASYWLFSKRAASVSSWYGFLCKAAAEHLGWDSAFVVSFPAGEVLASAGATVKQKEGAAAVLGSSETLKGRAVSRALFSSLSGSEKEGLILRAAFQADEAVAVPVSIGKDHSVYLAVSFNGERRPHQASEEAYLSKFAAAAGNVIALAQAA